MIPGNMFRASRRRNKVATQRMNRSAAQYGSPNATQQLDSFSSDGTNPATVTGGNTLSQVGSGDTVVEGSVTFTTSYASPVTLQLRKNGTTVASSPATTTPATITATKPAGATSAGDLWTLWAVYDFYGGNQVANAGYIEVRGA